MNNAAPTFAKQDNLKFFRTLNSRVNNYFKEKNELNPLEATADAFGVIHMVRCVAAPV